MNNKLRWRKHLPRHKRKENISKKLPSKFSFWYSTYRTWRSSECGWLHFETRRWLLQSDKRKETFGNMTLNKKESIIYTPHIMIRGLPLGTRRANYQYSDIATQKGENIYCAGLSFGILSLLNRLKKKRGHDSVTYSFLFCLGRSSENNSRNLLRPWSAFRIHAHRLTRTRWGFGSAVLQFSIRVSWQFP